MRKKKEKKLRYDWGLISLELKQKDNYFFGYKLAPTENKKILYYWNWILNYWGTIKDSQMSILNELATDEMLYFFRT